LKGVLNDGKDFMLLQVFEEGEATLNMAKKLKCKMQKVAIDGFEDRIERGNG